MRAFTRLGTAVCLSSVSLISFILLLPRSKVSTKLQKIALGATIDEYVPSFWTWASEDESEVEGGIRLVVFGDSWVDDNLYYGGQRKGLAWVDVLCEEINSTSRLNFAVSKSIEAYPSFPPTGALTSNSLYLDALNSSLPGTSADMPENPDLLPDFQAQIKQYLSIPPPKYPPKETVFIVSFGAWDIYHYSGLNFSVSQELVDSTVDEIFVQLDILYERYRKAVLEVETSNPNNTAPPPFRIIIPKLFDPTFLPGWVTQRPVPMTPSSVAEQQKNAFYLTTRWNGRLETRLEAWIKNDTRPVQSGEIVTGELRGGNDRDETKGAAAQPPNNDFPETKSAAEPLTLTVLKDAFYYDLPRYLTSVIIEQQLVDSGISDATGLGTKGTSFESVSYPCVVSAEEEPRPGDIEVNGLLICKDAEEYLFWDDFRLGPTANENIGFEVAKMMNENQSIRTIWAEGKRFGH